MSITDALKDVVKAVKIPGEFTPVFHYGYPKEIAGKLNQKDRDKIKKLIKYPMIVLWLPVEEFSESGLVKFTLNIGMYAKTIATLDSEDRYANKIKTVLEPLYKRFIEEIQWSGFFVWQGDLESPPHTKTVLPYGSREGGKTIKNIFNDNVDAIELTNLKISIVANQCDPIVWDDSDYWDDSEVWEEDEVII